MLFEIFCLIAILIFVLYLQHKSNDDYWKVRGIRGPEPQNFFSLIKSMLVTKAFIGDTINKMYENYKDEKMIGMLGGRIPILILKDPDLIKDILIKDFSKFADRGIRLHEKVNPLSAHLFTLEPKRWRPLRKSLSPVFTSGKLKEMFSLILKSSDNLEEYLKKIVHENDTVECRKLTAKFTTDVIGSCAFGIEINAFTDKNNEFLRIGKKIFDVGFKRIFKIRLMQTFPNLYDFLGTLLSDTELDNFFINLIKDTIEYRKENNVVRHDFVDLLRHMRENPENLGDIDLTDNLLAAQANVFFAAGFETSSTTMSNALYELALNHSIQEKLYQEISEIFQKSEINLSYENVKNMKYLHQVFQETLRKYPPVPFLMRCSLDEYTFSGTNVKIPKGQRIWIPAYSLQRDSKYYPNPEIFDPERFSDDEVNLRHPMLFLPFGDGPRNCIGARFADYQTKVGLIKILKNYKVDVCEETPIPYENNVNSFLLRPKEGIPLKFIKIESSQ